MGECVCVNTSAELLEKNRRFLCMLGLRIDGKVNSHGVSQGSATNMASVMMWSAKEKYSHVTHALHEHTTNVVLRMIRTISSALSSFTFS